MTNLEFIYVGDPMCSWCWGFAPVLDELQRTFTIPIRLIAGGLRPGDAAQPLDDRMRGYLAHHWEQVEKRTGQPFDRAVLERDGWIYDTETADTAVVTMRELNPKETLRFFVAVQHAFYAGGIDVTDASVYPELLESFDIDRDRFMTALVSPEMRERTWADFGKARRLGANGFPTLLLNEGDRMVVAAPGYVAAEHLVPSIRDWLNTHHAPIVASLMCDLDGEVC